MSCTGQKEESVTDGGVCPHTSGSVTYVVCWKQHEWCCNTSGCVISECGRVCVGTVSERGLTQRGQSQRWRTLTESRERDTHTQREKKGATTTKRETERDVVQRVQGQGGRDVVTERESEREIGREQLEPGIFL